MYERIIGEANAIIAMSVRAPVFSSSMSSMAGCTFIHMYAGRLAVMRMAVYGKYVTVAKWFSHTDRMIRCSTTGRTEVEQKS